MDRDSTRGDRKPDQPLPGSVSNQNAEEGEPGHEGRSERHRKPSGGSGDGNASGGADGPAGGNSGEGSQSTGNPASAG